MADYDAKKTMCSDSLEGCPTLSRVSLQIRRDREREVMKSNRYFPFKVEALGVCVVARGERLSERAGESLTQAGSGVQPLH